MDMVVGIASLSLDAASSHSAVSNIDQWPQYGNSTSNFVFRTDQSYIEKDDDRVEGVVYINTIVR
jgi:acetylcholinesterase